VKDPETWLREYVTDEIHFNEGLKPGQTTHTRDSLREYGANFFLVADYFSDEHKWIDQCFRKAKGWELEAIEAWWAAFFEPQSLARFYTALEAKVFLRDLCRDLQFPGWREQRNGTDQVPRPAPVPAE
jgi:hypothetical protein